MPLSIYQKIWHYLLYWGLLHGWFIAYIGKDLVLDNKLRDCHWCKSTAKVEQDMDLTWYVCCSFSKCAVAPITAPYEYRRQAVMVWNCCGQPDLMPAPIKIKG